MRRIAKPLIIPVLLAGLAGVGGPARCGSKTETPAGALKKLENHTLIFQRRVEKVTDGVHVAIGYGLANSILIEGKTGVIIVDTMETREAAGKVLAEFRKISTKPVKAIVYTHNHADHIFGAQVFKEAGQGNVKVIAHKKTAGLVYRIVNRFRPIIGVRSMRMFGNIIPRKDRVNNGIGPYLAIENDSTVGFIKPNITVGKKEVMTIDGVDIEFYHAPGETDDQIFVWLPDKKVLMPGDNYYHAFPNLYTIRGTPFRSLRDWYRSLDKMIAKKPQYLVPSHSGPLSGEKKIRNVLTDYRDAIQYTHDQAIRGINSGLTLEQLGKAVELPPHLKDKPYLQPFYGKVSWSVKSMFAGNLGWFDGDPSNLGSLDEEDKAGLIAELAGGAQAVLQSAQKNFEESKLDNALFLSSVYAKLEPSSSSGLELRTKILRKLAGREINPNARNFYLSEAWQIEKGFDDQLQKGKPSKEFVHELPLKGFFEVMAVNLDGPDTSDVDEAAVLRFTDLNQVWTIHIRRGLADIRKAPPDKEINVEIDVSLSSKDFKEMLAKLRGPLATLPTFNYAKGGSVSFGVFLAKFQPPSQKMAFLPVEK